MAEFGCCHRNEPSGALHGLMRVRGFTQDDAHVFCTEEQIMDEVSANGKARAGKRVLTVGTDCSVGKMYSVLAIEQRLEGSPSIQKDGKWHIEDFAEDESTKEYSAYIGAEVTPINPTWFEELDTKPQAGRMESALRQPVESEKALQYQME